MMAYTYSYVQVIHIVASVSTLIYSPTLSSCCWDFLPNDLYLGLSRDRTLTALRTLPARNGGVLLSLRLLDFLTLSLERLAGFLAVPECRNLFAGDVLAALDERPMPIFGKGFSLLSRETGVVLHDFVDFDLANMKVSGGLVALSLGPKSRKSTN